MGKDDDTVHTIRYNEGCECRIGPDLLKAFQAKKAVEILSEDKKSPPKTNEKEETQDSDVEEATDVEKSDTNDEHEKDKESPKKKKKKSK